VPVLRIDSHTFAAADLTPAVNVLRDGGVVAFPTDTFYGLAADPTQPEAVERVFAIKARAGGEALPLIAVSIEAVEQFCGRMDGAVARLAHQFWPGPLALLFDAPAVVAPAVHAGTGAVAIRVPDHPVARALTEAFGRPLTATSANLSGQPPVRDAAGLADLGPSLFVVDGGVTAGGAPSTIVDARVRPPRLVREGAVPWERVLTFLSP
jgi:L-threonylcarbamoyladenylate synthase